MPPGCHSEGTAEEAPSELPPEIQSRPGDRGHTRGRAPGRLGTPPRPPHPASAAGEHVGASPGSAGHRNTLGEEMPTAQVGEMETVLFKKE